MIAVDIESQARSLADENRKSDPSIKRIFWFPHDHQICLVELTDEIPIASDGELHPFWFRPSPRLGLSVASGIALIRPDEYGKLILPKDWPAWDQAREI